MGDRYQVIFGSQSKHCCFEATVVDTAKPVIIGGQQYRGQFEPVCECFSISDAYKIAAALSAQGEENDKWLGSKSSHRC